MFLRHNLADQLSLFKPGPGQALAGYAQHITVCPPGFKKLSKPLYLKSIKTFRAEILTIFLLLF